MRPHKKTALKLARVRARARKAALWEAVAKKKQEAEKQLA
jgi:hypothetical protein